MAEQQLKVSRQQRGQAKRSMTVIEKYLNKFGENGKLDSLVDGEVKLEDLKRIHSKFEEANNEITECMVQLEATEEELEEHSKEFEHFEERYSSATSKLNNLVEQAKIRVAASQPIPVPSVPKNSFQTSLKLPEIHLPTFDGQLVNYQSFKETFKALVHKDVRLGAIQKFFYLKGCLKNVSLFAEISSLDLTEENYDLAWELLVSRYENRKTLVNQHIKAIFNLPKVERNSASSMRQLIDNVSKHVHCLKSQGITMNDAVLTYIVTSKIDSLTHQLWEAHDSNLNVDAVASFECLKLFITNRARALENVEEFDQRNPKALSDARKFDKVPAYGHKQGFHPAHKSKVLAATNAEIKCFYCQGNHFLWRCSSFLSSPITGRLDFVLKKGLCEKCLRNHHGDCKTPFLCRVCGSAHHNSLLHRDK